MPRSRLDGRQDKSLEHGAQSSITLAHSLAWIDDSNGRRAAWRGQELDFRQEVIPVPPHKHSPGRYTASARGSCALPSSQRHHWSSLRVGILSSDSPLFFFPSLFLLIFLPVYSGVACKYIDRYATQTYEKRSINRVFAANTFVIDSLP